MKIRILKGCSGSTFSYRQNEEVEVSATLGKDLVDGGLAEEVKETATTPKKKAGAKADADHK